MEYDYYKAPKFSLQEAFTPLYSARISQKMYYAVPLKMTERCKRKVEFCYVYRVLELPSVDIVRTMKKSNATLHVREVQVPVQLVQAAIVRLQ